MEDTTHHRKTEVICEYKSHTYVYVISGQDIVNLKVQIQEPLIRITQKVPPHTHTPHDISDKLTILC